MIYFLFCLINLLHLVKCGYKISHSGNIVITNQFNSIVDIKLLGENDAFNLELSDIIRFPVYCIPFSTIDYNSSSNRKSIYFIKHEFKNLLYLYKNNVKIMPIIFPDRDYISGLAVNNGFILMITDIDLYKIDTEKKKINLLNVEAGKYTDIYKNKEMFFSSVISDSIENHFFIICSIRVNYYILHVRYDEKNDCIEILNVIDNIDNEPLRVVNGVAVIENRLYITENAENIIRFTLDREKNNAITENVFSYTNGNKIVSLSGNSKYDKELNENTDYLIVNSKKISSGMPSSESCLDLLKINKNNTDLFNIVDLFSKDINFFYFNIYDAHIFVDDQYEPMELTNALNEKANFLKYNKKKELEIKKKQESNKYILKIIWTNDYNCTINKGFVDIRKYKIEKNGEKKLPFTYITNQYAFAPYTTSVSHCSKKNSIFKAICYYDSVNNYVNILNEPREYNTEFTGTYHFDGFKDNIAFDYKSISNIHVLTYPFNNTVYVYFDKKYIEINLPQPFGISIDKSNSFDGKVIIYVTGNDDKNNYVNKCVISKLEKEYECYNVFNKKKKYNELFQYISYITIKSEGEELTYVYVTNNKKTIYRLHKQDKKWIFNTWFQLDDPSQRIGPISTSLNYFYVTKKALKSLIATYPDSKMLLKIKNAKKEDLYITDDKYIFLTASHTVIFCANNDSYGRNSGSTIHFYASILKEKYYQSFGVNSIVFNISNDSKFNYYLN
ncbi:translocon component PTEX88, putative [Plasmodium gallinaceum]|uniref:Translocon component PTEX88, putative n=1 Tax=Plasmodium gallinaceum TaxID=5849 RepID=A0A1J1GUH7_PLAGA|nr:translocon component PTEX88, putative [Plasmodium gallinaceum]CRG96114.1 translocon component PTEX88, putative [Plasmodium gallinaceum]